MLRAGLAVLIASVNYHPSRLISMARQHACVPQARPQEAGMLQAGLAVLIATLDCYPPHLSVKQHGSTACMCAASAATGGRNAPSKARCSHCQSNHHQSS